jgi:hypothetical protein
MQETLSGSADLNDRLAQSCQIIELLEFELAQEKECYSAYYLDLFFNSNKDSVEGAVQLTTLAELHEEVMMLKGLLCRAEIDKTKLVEQNASLWKIIFALLKSDKKK